MEYSRIAARLLPGAVMCSLVLTGCFAGTDSRESNHAESSRQPSSADEAPPTLGTRSAAEVTCDDGLVVSISGTAVLRPGARIRPAYTASVADEDGQSVSYLTGMGEGGGGFASTRLMIGQSIEDRGIGTFILMDAMTGSEDEPGGGGTSVFCFVPEEDFELSYDLAEQAAERGLKQS